jgi:hypothetical protein
MRRSRKSESLKGLLNSLVLSPFWSPIPCREAEISFISEFIRVSFSSDHPRVLVVVGHSKTGKTSALSLCAAMSPHCDRIGFEKVGDSFEFSSVRRLVIFDDFDPTRPIGEIFEAVGRANYSIVFVSPEPLGLSEISMAWHPSILNFGRYSSGQLVDILKEKVGACDCVKEELLREIAVKVWRSRGTVPDAVELLVRAVRAAIRGGKAAVDAGMSGAEEEPPDLIDCPQVLRDCRVGFDA